MEDEKIMCESFQKPCLNFKEGITFIIIGRYNFKFKEFKGDCRKGKWKDKTPIKINFKFPILKSNIFIVTNSITISN